ncbi:hypothetical protein HG535_0D01690 [Zygotorulaspora mrakii]|uniref:Nuclear pore complex protein n=1 Tax=Zygotorulaspora mrakii TaxID=42260 RepID=A0A7H9B1F0_ZYGMR|nr:uncharacterized protein HG535_0D01690 [Zygotorulaspora mrakii]QLG72461.1 hypothetical protein HG535_0D01690 [Zygotorulaspora mrakii]
MEIDGPKDVDFFLKSANTLKDFEIEGLDGKTLPDPFNIIKEFRSIAGEASLKFSKTDSEASLDWELEAKLWHILELLLNYRTSDHDLDTIDVHPFNSNAVMEKELLQKNRELYQIWIVIVWIQDNMKPVERPSNLPTSKWSNTIISGGLKSCDLDFPLRDSEAEIDPRDKEEDNVFFRYLFELLIAGKFEEAIEACGLTDNLTMSMILTGMQEYMDPNIDTQLGDELETHQGIKKHALWRRAVFSLSQNLELSSYERAIYSFLAGDIPPDKVLATSSWDLALLFYLNKILQTEIENYLLQNNKIEKGELILGGLSSQSPSIQNVLDIISARYESESEHPLRVLIAAVILDTLPSVLHSSVEVLLDIIKGVTTEDYLGENPYLLRVVTHISIVLDIISPGFVSSSDKSKLITAYVSIMKLRGLYEIIPIYISFLEEEDIIEAFSFILSTLKHPEIRTKQIEIANFLKLPTSNILRKTTQRVFMETEDDYTPKGEIEVTTVVSEVDKHLILGVEWLIEGKLYIDAMDSVIALSRRFLLNGRIKSLEYFMDHNNIENLIKNYDLEKISNRIFADEGDDKTKELLDYRLLIDELKKHEEWQKIVGLLNSESNIPSLIEKFQEYSRGTHDLIKGFLVELSELESHADKDIFFEIRALYTPYLIIELHKGLVEAASLLRIPTFIKDALNIANLVANEADKIYLLFQSSGKLKEYLRLVARTATLTGSDFL